jgi:dipeptidyl aminopeptidase/acylaminoacyl peptidase
MLHRNGFAVLLIDLRDHGDSTFEDGRYAGGTEEYRDVLGAWDWLREARDLPPDRIGLLGVSLGAATALIAAGEERAVAAAWEDSSYADIEVAIRAELVREHYPAILQAGGILMARVLSGDDLASLSPIGGVRKLGTRPLFITHGTDDQRLSVDYAHDLEAARRSVGGIVESWIVEGADHVDAMALHPAEYEERLVDFFDRTIRR